MKRKTVQRKKIRYWRGDGLGVDSDDSDYEVDDKCNDNGEAQRKFAEGKLKAAEAELKAVEAKLKAAEAKLKAAEAQRKIAEAEAEAEAQRKVAKAEQVASKAIDNLEREHAVIDLTADDHDGEPVAQRRRLREEPDHLLCPITHEMFRDPVMVMESGHTYERAAIKRHLQNNRTDPLTRDRIGTVPVTNRIARNAVQAWLDENPGVTPDGWESREIPLPTHAPPMQYCPDLEVLRRWRESCSELRDMWRDDYPILHWKGVTWSDGRVTGLRINGEGLSGQLPRLEGLTSLQTVDLSDNRLSGPIPEKLFEGLTSLEYVDLSNNQLSGPIPESLRAVVKLY